MNIEVACCKGDNTKKKGDLLEKLAKKFLESQSYSVIEEIKFTGTELDLLCKHKVSNRQIYVECKAQKDNISAPILRQLLGTVYANDYSEGWLISTAELGKEAKGFIEEFKAKPREKAEKLSFYSPSDVIASLQCSSIIRSPPISEAESFVKGSEYLGDWTLLISEYGMYWCVYTLQGGVPFGVLVYNAKNNKHIQDLETLNNLKNLDSTLAEFDLKFGYIDNQIIDDGQQNVREDFLPSVVEVQTADSWNDYRPARPQDFIGRDDVQKEIFNFLNIGKTSTNRIFAITGNSGLGKSSLIAKLREKSRNKFYKNSYFIYAVDMRGATTSNYISASLLKCLKLSQENGFGDKIELKITNPISPLSSPSISQYLDSLIYKKQVICLIFDQFEELYSKPDLFSIFNAAQVLMVDVVAQQKNLFLGFAWKTDSTTQQDHPAYHMWHDLSDYRREYKLGVFDNGEIAKCITKFEKEINKKISVGLRHQISHSCQGFPWLLKKLCINFYESLDKSQVENIIDLDVVSLFEADIDKLTHKEYTCLKLIAQNAPADWSEIIDASDNVILSKLINKRLVIKSGDRLNIYWDIFKDYLLTGKTPVIPFNYIPTTDFITILNVASTLSKEYLSAKELADKTKLKEKTIWNIGADLVMFGLAERESTNFRLKFDITKGGVDDFLNELRCKFGNHVLKLVLYKDYSGKIIDEPLIKNSLKKCLSNAKVRYAEKTWRAYTKRLINFLFFTGYIVSEGNKFLVKDVGSYMDYESILTKPRKRVKNIFTCTVSAEAVLDFVRNIKKDTDKKQIKRNTLTILKRFNLVYIKGDLVCLNQAYINSFDNIESLLCHCIRSEKTLMKSIELHQKEPTITSSELALYISNEFKLNWSRSTIKRNGSLFIAWVKWYNENS